MWTRQIVSPPSPWPPCTVLPDPNTDQRCGAECLSGHTVLDNAVCDECFEAVAL